LSTPKLVMKCSSLSNVSMTTTTPMSHSSDDIVSCSSATSRLPSRIPTRTLVSMAGCQESEAGHENGGGSCVELADDRKKFE
jgi:hypothetical protein